MEDRLVPIILNYPEVVLWDTDVGRKKLKIINKGDFPIDDVLNGIGVSSSKLSDSFGITDGKEIKARLELTKFLEARPDFRNWVKSTDLGDLELPLKEESFLKYFNPERASNPFWEKIHEFISFLPESSQTPYGLRVMRDFLKSSLVMEDPEKKMGRMMTEKIEGMATIEGTITLLVNVLKDINEPVYSIKSCQKHAHGYQEYSSSIVNIKFESYPNWVDNKWNPLNWVGFGE